VGGEARLEEQAEAQASAREKFERFSESVVPHTALAGFHIDIYS